MRSRVVSLVAAVVAGWALLARPAEAIPAFARQTGASCSACHFQHFPGLTAYGRMFKSSGYTLSAGPLIEGRHLSLSNVLNASLVTKVRYVKTDGAVGEFQFPDEAALWLGGRVGTNIGFVLEAQLTSPGDPMFASFKMPIGIGTRAGRVMLVPFTTDGLGAPFGFELLNTGAVRNIRMQEAGDAFSASQYMVSPAGGKAEGITVALAGSHGFVSVTPWTPSHGTVALDRPAWYLRGVWTPSLGGFDLGLGVQRWTGTAQATNQATDAWGMDFQAQGRWSQIPVGVYAGYARATGSPGPISSFINPEPRLPGAGIQAIAGTATALIPPPGNLFNSELGVRQAVSLSGEVGVIPERLTLSAGYRFGRNGKDAANNDLAGVLGATFLLVQNIQVQVNHVIAGGDAWTGVAGKQKTILMVFAAF